MAQNAGPDMMYSQPAFQLLRVLQPHCVRVTSVADASERDATSSWKEAAGRKREAGSGKAGTEGDKSPIQVPTW